MSMFADVMATNPPRLVVVFQRQGDGTERFQWGIEGSMPILSLIGHLIRVQADLVSGAWIPHADLGDGSEESVLAVVWNDAECNFTHYVDPEIPALPLAGMLETIKEGLVVSRMAQSALANRVQLVGLDGLPISGISRGDGR